MLRRWKKALFLSIAVAVRSAVVPMARFSDLMRAKADGILLPVIVLAIAVSVASKAVALP